MPCRCTWCWEGVHAEVPCVFFRCQPLPQPLSCEAMTLAYSPCEGKDRVAQAPLRHGGAALPPLSQVPPSLVTTALPQGCGAAAATCRTEHCFPKPKAHAQEGRSLSSFLPFSPPPSSPLLCRHPSRQCRRPLAPLPHLATTATPSLPIPSGPRPLCRRAPVQR